MADKPQAPANAPAHMPAEVADGSFAGRFALLSPEISGAGWMPALVAGD
ncbi:MAG TPA: hypothetical protein VEY11_10160 [Pyrinomonadaceae bacterium]|nr:hypothetical protein [Pyrinomonadaceae bacterium]